MTNEEKAFELSSISKYGFSTEKSNAAYNAALEAMQWKDKQLKLHESYLLDTFEKTLEKLCSDCNDEIYKTAWKEFADKMINKPDYYNDIVKNY